MSFRKSVEFAAEQNPDKPFLWCHGKSYTYGEALKIKDNFSESFGRFDHIAIVSNSGDISYLSIFAAVVLKATYMHLNIDWGPNRLADVLGQATPDLVVCHREWAIDHTDAFRILGYEVVPAYDPTDAFFSRLTVFRKRDKQNDCLADYKLKKGVEDILYVMFTSGSTGLPKGVPIDVTSAALYAQSMVETYSIDQYEQWMQPVDLHFDVSMMTVLPAWITSGHIIAIPSKQSPFGPRFVKKFPTAANWTSVPSVIARSNALGMLKENVMPGLKRSFFCGEALPSDMAATWAAAAPRSSVYNLYGPTEATIALSWYKFDKTVDQEPVVPIGKALPGSKMRLAKDGEIELGGPQVFHGYLGNPQKIETYLEVEEDGTRWYKTGDIGHMSDAGVMHFKGRKDWQVKVRGYRVEVEGVEAAIRKITDSSLVAVVPVDEVSKSSFDRLCAFVEPGVDTKNLKSELGQILPDYMVPSLILELADFPKNANGKIDRNTLVSFAEKESEK